MHGCFQIDRLGPKGDGIAAGPVFAQRTLPGETVEGTVDGTVLKNMRITTPSPDRVHPPCRHYKSCGGCQLQHASDDFVAAWKEEIARKALNAQGIETTWRPMAISPPKSRRRATFAVRRTKRGALAGFYGRASDTITEVPDCQLLEPAILDALPLLELLAVNGASRKGVLSVTITNSEAGLDVSVSGGKPLDGPLQLTLGRLAETHAIARLSWDGEVIALRRPPSQRFDGITVVPPPGAFLQATTQGEDELIAAVQEIVRQADRIVDLFAGCGTFSLPLARAGEVHAVEGERAMMQALDLGWRQAEGLKRVTTEARDLFRRPLMPDELKGFAAAVIDPPRAGAEAQIAALAAADVPVIAHVSCNPISFARDARTLCDAGYALEWIQVIDQFRWSVHTELVASFRRRR